jgi:hypothetical protein
VRLFIIGRLMENKKVVAFKLYDANGKKTGIYPKKNVYEAVKRKGIQVVGLSRTKDGLITGVHSSFNINKTDVLNGKGFPIKPTDIYVLVGYSGFLEETKYRLINSRGYQRIVNKEEFEELVKEGKVNGATLSTRVKDKINIYAFCGYREWDY